MGQTTQFLYHKASFETFCQHRLLTMCIQAPEKFPGRATSNGRKPRQHPCTILPQRYFGIKDVAEGRWWSDSPVIFKAVLVYVYTMFWQELDITSMNGSSVSYLFPVQLRTWPAALIISSFLLQRLLYPSVSAFTLLSSSFNLNFPLQVFLWPYSVTFLRMAQPTLSKQNPGSQYSQFIRDRTKLMSTYWNRTLTIPVRTMWKDYIGPYSDPTNNYGKKN